MTHLDDYIRYWETVTPDRVHDIDGIITDDMVLIDPFNHVTGVAAFKAVIHKMFDDADDPRFIVTKTAITEDGKTAFLRWDFTFRTKGRSKLWSMCGVSEISIAADGRITAHHDHWDTGSQLLHHIPILGWPVTMVFKKLAVH